MDASAVTDALLILLALPLGVMVGRLHFRALRIGAEQLVSGEGAGRALGLKALRFAVTAGFLVGAALIGPGPLLGGAAGLAVGRAWEMRLARRAEGAS